MNEIVRYEEKLSAFVLDGVKSLIDAAHTLGHTCGQEPAGIAEVIDRIQKQGAVDAYGNGIIALAKGFGALVDRHLAAGGSLADLADVEDGFVVQLLETAASYEPQAESEPVTGAPVDGLPEGVQIFQM